MCELLVVHEGSTYWWISGFLGSLGLRLRTINKYHVNCDHFSSVHFLLEYFCHTYTQGAQRTNFGNFPNEGVILSPFQIVLKRTGIQATAQASYGVLWAIKCQITSFVMYL